MAAPELQSSDGVLIKTVEMHTGGEPLRVVVSGEQRATVPAIILLARIAPLGRSHRLQNNPFILYLTKSRTVRHSLPYTLPFTFLKLL